MRLASLFAVLLLPLAPAMAAPNVATDIAPVHALVAQLMRGVATPELLLPADADPHHHTLRPSQARALQQADMVIWIGPALTPWLTDALPRLAPDAIDLHLMEDDEHGHDHSHDHAADDPADDPHQWLDPVAMQDWLPRIAAALAVLDPANAPTYSRNLQTTQVELQSLVTRIDAQLTADRTRPIVTAHAALGPFATRFGLSVMGSLTDSDATRPGAAHIRTLRDQIIAQNVTCLLTERGQTPATLRALTDGLVLRLVEIDVLGARQPVGPDLYQATLSALSANIAACIAP